MATRDRTRDDKGAAARGAVHRHNDTVRRHNAKVRGEQADQGSRDVPEVDIRDDVAYIPSDEFRATARRITERRAGLLKRLAE